MVRYARNKEYPPKKTVNGIGTFICKDGYIH